MSNAARSAARSAALIATVLASVVTALVSGFFSSRADAQERAGNPALWRGYWEKMMPVFEHERCANCHGGTNPFDGENHGGGPVDSFPETMCIGCHTANTVLVPGRCAIVMGLGATITGPDGVETQSLCVPGELDQGEIRVPAGPVWNALAPDFMSFVGKDARTLCLQLKKNVAGPEALLKHLREDHLIEVAFEGTRGMDGQSPIPVEDPPGSMPKPPLSKEAFIELMTQWITEAAMSCRTDGTVDYKDDLTITSPPSPIRSMRIHNVITAAVKIESEVATSELHYDEASTAALRAPVPGCRPKQDVEAHFKADGTPDASYEIRIEPGLAYRMRFRVGSIQGQSGMSSEEELCRGRSSRSEDFPTEDTPNLFFEGSGQAVLSEAGKLILKGSAVLPTTSSTWPA
jgi:hypothetical protein